jgi:hypothetical protein
MIQLPDDDTFTPLIFLGSNQNLALPQEGFVQWWYWLQNAGFLPITLPDTMGEQSVQPEPRAARFLKSMLVSRGPVNRVVGRL